MSAEAESKDMETEATTESKPEELPSEAVDVQSEPPTYPNMELANTVFLLESKAPGNDAEARRSEILEHIKADSMAPYYTILCQRFGWEEDSQLLDDLRTKNADEKKRLQGVLEDAEQNHGESEVLDALFGLAQHQARIGAKDEAYRAFQTIVEKPKVSIGKRIDASMQKLRVALFHLDMDVARELVGACKKLVEDGGDWDRRNRLKVYEAMILVVERDVKAASKLLLEGIATFTCTELCSYEKFIMYAVITNTLYLDRPVLKKKIVEGPEVLGVIPAYPCLQSLVNGLYQCDYALFFRSLIDLNDLLATDRYLAPHATYLIRECRVLAYTQFLASYKSVMVSTMASVFGVSSEFLDRELSRFIAANRLDAKIDRVGGMVETVVSDTKNTQYQSLIKKGDLLLNRIQKLARVVDV